MTIHVAAVNDVPVAQPSSVTTNEDTSYTFAVSNFSFTDVEGNNLASITISGLALASGDTLKLSGVDVMLNQTILAASIPNIVYTPALNANGSARSTFNFKVNDADSGTVAAAMTIHVVAVNDVPAIAINSLVIAQGQSVVLSSLNVNATDVDNSAAQLVYTATGVSGGRFEFETALGVAVTSFTQDQINSGAVKFVHDGGLVTPGYSLTVNDGQLSSAASPANVTFTKLPAGVQLINGVLYVIGTESRDHIELKFDDKRSEWKIDAKLDQTNGDNGANRVQAIYSAAAINRIVAYLGGGDDFYNGSGSDISSVAIAQFVFGGDGNDHIQVSGLGSSLIVGGAGDDDIQGGNGRNILIGGVGKDNIKGGNEDDLLIAGYTSFDNNISALDLIFREWNSTSGYATRVNNMRSGTGAVLSGSGVKLQATGTDRTVFSDSSQDILKGYLGLDWFFADLGDNVNDKISSELLDLISI